MASEEDVAGWLQKEENCVESTSSAAGPQNKSCRERASRAPSQMLPKSARGTRDIREFMQGYTSSSAGASSTEAKASLKVLPGSDFFKSYNRLPEKASSSSEGNDRGKVGRSKEERQCLKGYDCACCKPYYDALCLSDAERKKRVEEVSRHRAPRTPPKTPEHYWNAEFLSTQDCLDRGYFRESPLYVPRTQKAYKKLYADCD